MMVSRSCLSRVPLALALLLACGVAPAQACGDCNSDGSLTILDALRQAQIAVVTIVGTPADLLLCDIDADQDIDVIDALVTAQFATGLPVVLLCPSQPTVTMVAALTGPTSGTDRVPVAGGETVEVTGTGFSAGSTVTVNGTVVAAAVVDPTTLTFVAPAAAAELTTDVDVTSPGGLVGTLVDGLTYTAEFSLAPFTGTFSREYAQHLYRRAAFGGTSAEIDTALLAGLTATTNSLVTFTNDPAVELAAQASYGGTLPPRPSVNSNINKEWWLHMILKNPNPFQERFAWFLHDHFAISERQMSSESRWTMFPYVNLMRRMSVGTGDTLITGEPGLEYDWPRLVVLMTKDRAMLDWLSGRVSVVGNPNENYARELWELFTLGEGAGYTEADIQEAARAFTGFFWYFTGGSGTTTPLEMRYRGQTLPYGLGGTAYNRHDGGAKNILGITGYFGYDDVSPFYETDPGPSGALTHLGVTDAMQLTDPADLDGGVVALTFQQRPVEASRFICRKLATFFLYDDPSDIVVDQLAADLRAPGPNQWNLKPIILEILRSQAFFSNRAVKGKYTDPIDYVIGFLRSTQIDLHTNPLTSVQRVRSRLTTLEQVVLDPPDVSGYFQDSSWITSQGMLQRFNFLNYAARQLDTISKVLAVVPSPRASITDAGLVDHIAGTLDVELSANARQRCIDYLNTTQAAPGGTPVPSTFNPMSDTELTMKTRGLFWIIGQYYDSHRQ